MLIALSFFDSHLLILTNAMIRLRTSGYSVLALAIRVKYHIDDATIFHGDLHLMLNDLERLPAGTTLPSLEAGETLKDTTAAGGGTPDLIFRTPDLIHNLKIVVHGLVLLFPHFHIQPIVTVDFPNIWFYLARGCPYVTCSAAKATCLSISTIHEIVLVSLDRANNKHRTVLQNNQIWLIYASSPGEALFTNSFSVKYKWEKKGEGDMFMLAHPFHLKLLAKSGRLKYGIKDTLVRFSFGVEDFEDLKPRSKIGMDSFSSLRSFTLFPDLPAFHLIGPAVKK